MSNFEERKANLKEIRNKFLKFHKILLDWERARYEKEFGVVTSGKFLELLLGDPRFAWLRSISMLIVRIDETFDLSDGFSNEMLNGFFEEIGNLFDTTEEYQEFKEKLALALPENPESKALKSEIEELISE